MTLGELFLKYRSRRSQSQVQLADRIGVASSTVNRIEQGREFKMRTLTAVNIARAMLNGYPPMSAEDAENLRVELELPEPIWRGLLNEMVPADRPTLAHNAQPISEAMALVGELIGLIGPDQSLAMIRGMVAAVRTIQAPAPIAPLAQNARLATNAELNVVHPPKPRPDLGPGIIEQEIRTYGVEQPGGERRPKPRRAQG